MNWKRKRKRMVEREQGEGVELKRQVSEEED